MRHARTSGKRRGECGADEIFCYMSLNAGSAVVRLEWREGGVGVGVGIGCSLREEGCEGERGRCAGERLRGVG